VVLTDRRRPSGRALLFNADFQPRVNLFSSLRDGKSLGLLAANTPSIVDEGCLTTPLGWLARKRTATLDDASLSNQTEAPTPRISADDQGAPGHVHVRGQLPRLHFSPRKAAVASKPPSGLGRLLSAGGAAALAMGGAAAMAALAGSGNRKEHGKAAPEEPVGPLRETDQSTDKLDAGEATSPMKTPRQS
jgi:hypothetical protein